MTDSLELTSDALYRRCDLRGLAFITTADLEPLPGFLGQERAREAVEFGVGVRARGYNLFVLGAAGFGKRGLVREMLEGQSRSESTPNDWCYVNNFKQPHRPTALRLPAGGGVMLRKDMAQLVDELRATIPALFESDEYRSRVEHIEAEINEEQEKAFAELGQEASKDQVVLLRTPAGFSLAPTQDGEVMRPEVYEKLPPAKRQRVDTAMVRLQENLQKAIRQLRQLQREKRSRIKDLTREMTLAVIGHLIDDLKHRYAELPAVLSYLDHVQADLLDSLEQFRRPAEMEAASAETPDGDLPALARYTVNVLVGDNGAVAGAPIVEEDYPTYANLLGRVEYVARMGVLVTDFSLIKAGSLHRANGGYLLIDAHKLLTQPFAWEGLKRALSTQEIRTESLGQSFGLVSTAALEPAPIPLDVKVVLLGERILYYLLMAYDPEFSELFKVQVDFEDDVLRTAEHEGLYARLMAALSQRDGLLPMERRAVERVIEQAARWAGDAGRLSAHLERLNELLRESNYCARSTGAAAVSADHVERALGQQVRRAGRIREKVHEAILNGQLLIDTDGLQVGQINGLSVSMVGTHAFAFPTRITATTRLGDGELIDIQREAELSGPIHSKGVMILSAFLAARYRPDYPHSLAASLAFEQTYGPVEGDSASVAELVALLSSLGNFPIRQALAVTGSISQHGHVQPIGAVNEKIEGFFEICRARGLTGDQGVVIPQANVRDLMLRADLVAAVAARQFHVFAVATSDQALEVLTGLEAGAPDSDGQFPAGTANFRVATRLAQLAKTRQTFAAPSAAPSANPAAES